MPPQPLSRVHPTANAFVGPDALTVRPKFAPLISEIIARWAFIEADLRTILSYVLRAESAPIAAMLHAVVSASAQMEMIVAAGREKLFDPELELFEAVIKVARTAAKSRNAVAHHIWAWTDFIPDCLLLLEPEAYSEIFVSWHKDFDAHPPTSIVHGNSPHRSRMMVYREQDFLEIIGDMKIVSKCTVFLINYLIPTYPSRDQMYRFLCSEPLIDAALSTLRKNRQPRPRPQPPNSTN